MKKEFNKKNLEKKKPAFRTPSRFVAKKCQQRRKKG